MSHHHARAEPTRPAMVVRATARPWPAWLLTSVIVLVGGSTMLVTDVVAPGIPSALTAVLVIAAFAVMSCCAAVITFRWRTSLRFDGANLVVRDPLGARVVALGVDVRLTRWLDAGTQKPVMWIVRGDALVAPVSPLLPPVQVEALAIAAGVPVVDLDDPPPSIVR